VSFHPLSVERPAGLGVPVAVDIRLGADEAGSDQAGHGWSTVVVAAAVPLSQTMNTCLVRTLAAMALVIRSFVGHAADH
jgi:hypothetical protein